MKLKLLRQVLYMSKFAFYGLLLQFVLFGVLLANDGNGQRLSIDDIKVDVVDEAFTVEEFFAYLEQASELTFSFYSTEIDLSKELYFSTGRYTLRQILERVAKQTGYRFKRVNDQVYVNFSASRPPGIVEEVPDVAEVLQVRITGKVTELETGEPLPGVSILIKGTTDGTTTDIDGNYALSAPEGSTLRFSYIGFLVQEVTVGNQTTLDIALRPDMEQLDEVVVVGYGAVRKSDLTGAVANVDGEDLANLPSPRIDQLLQGRMAGVNITSTSGAPGAQTSIRIRGGNSISGDNEPLYVIDGFVVGTNFDLNSINVNDIESIDVLKDASSISIYGTRGANGVILITTKSGKGTESGKPSISVGMYTGMQEVLRDIDFMGGEERREWGREFARFTFNPNDPFQGIEGDTDWQDVLTEAAPITNVDFSMSGNNKDVNYYFSANYFNQRGIIKNTGLSKYTIRSNIDYKINDMLTIGSRLNVTMRDQDNEALTFGDLNGQLTRALTAYPRFDDEGEYWSTGVANIFDNPEALIDLNTNQTFNTNILGNFYVEFEPIQDLKIKSTLGISAIWDKNNRFESGRNTVRAAANLGGLGRISNFRRVELLQENTVSYNKQINENHSINILGGFTWQVSEAESFFAQTQLLPNDAISFDDLSVGDQGTYRIGSGFPEPFQLVSWIGRVNYNLMDKYLFTFSGRVDGSSRFSGSNNEYAFFPSGAFAWRVKDEAFLADVDMISDMKLRASYGLSGNQSIGSLATQARYRTSYIILNDAVAPSVEQIRPPNPGLTWETTAQLDLGLEVGLWNNRLSLEFDYYYKRTNDLLIELDLSGQTGFISPTAQNVGSLENRGVELLLNSVNVDKGDFKWVTTLTLAANRSKVLEIGGLDELLVYNSDVTGPTVKLLRDQPVGVFSGVEYLGTWRDQAQIDNSGFSGNAFPGGPRYADTNGDGLITAEDYTVIGDPEPDFFGGLQNTISYKNLTLDILFQGTFGNDIYNELAAFAFFGLEDRNLYAEVVNRWTPENPGSRIPRAGAITVPSEAESNSELIEDGTHIRLKNVMLSYSINTSNKLNWLNSLNVYVAGSNLLLFSDFRGYDPESKTNVGGNTTPYANVIRGLVRAEYPSARMYTVGISANF